MKDELDYNSWLEQTAAITAGLLSVHHGISVDAAIELFKPDIDKAVEDHQGKDGTEHWIQLTRKVMSIMVRELERPTI